MSYADGWAALNLEKPPRVPRTEYSAEMHWDLVEAVSGLPVDRSNLQDDVDEPTRRAQAAFYKAWDYGLNWAVDIGHWPMVDGRMPLNGRHTNMGHAEYAEGGTDRDDEVVCPFTDVEEVLNFDPMEEYGLPDASAMVKNYEERYRARCDIMPDAVNMGGIYISMFSGLIDIFGWEMMLLAAGEDADRFGEMARRYEKWIQPFFEAFAATEIPVMMSHDDIAWTSGPVLHPDWYCRYIFPAYKRLWQPVLDSGKKLIFTSDGDYTMFFDDIVHCGAQGCVMEPCCDMAAFAGQYGKTHAFVGNVDTRILLSGTQSDIRAEVERCMAIGKDCPGFFMAVGNHIPANTPLENVLYYNDVYMEMRQR